MEHMTIRATATYLCNPITTTHSVLFFDEDSTAVSISTHVEAVVVDYDQIPVPQKPTARVNHLTGSCSVHRVTATTGNINAFVYTTAGSE